MNEAGVPTAGHVVFDSYEQAEAQIDCASYPAVLKADGLAAGKGVIIAADPREAREALRGFFLERPLRRRRRHGRRWRSSSRARSCRCSRSATARTSCRWRPRRTTSGSATATTGPNTGGMGSYSPVPGFDAERAPRSSTASPRAGRRRAARARHPVPRRPVRGPDADRGRARRCSSSTAASATPRRRRCCRGCAATCSTLLERCAEPGGLAAPSSSGRTTGR